MKTIANRALERVLNCCISAPTGKSASLYAKEFPECRVNTVHTNYFIPVGTTNKNTGINRGLTDIHVLLVDKVRFHFIESILISTEKLLWKIYAILLSKLTYNVFILFLRCYRSSWSLVHVKNFIH